MGHFGNKECSLQLPVFLAHLPSAPGIDRQIADSRLAIRELALSVKEQQGVQVQRMIGIRMVVLVAVLIAIAARLYAGLAR